MKTTHFVPVVIYSIYVFIVFIHRTEHANLVLIVLVGLVIGMQRNSRVQPLE